MNVENMLKLADFIEKHPENFDMTCFGPTRMATYGEPACGTAGCIAGWAHAFQVDEDPSLQNQPFFHPEIWLGLTPRTANKLFFASPSVWKKYHAELDFIGPPSIFAIKAHHAVTMLRKLASGEWNFYIGHNDTMKEQY